MRGLIAVLLPQVFELVAHGEVRDAAVQFMDLLVRFLVELARLGQEIADLGIDLLFALLELMPLLGREVIELLLLERLALHERDLDDACAGDRELEPQFQGAPAGLAEEDLFRLFGVFHDAGLLFLVLFGLEDLGDLALHELDELLHVAPELAPFARRQT